MLAAVLYSLLFHSTRTGFSFTRYYHMRSQLINLLIEYIYIYIYTDYCDSTCLGSKLCVLGQLKF